MDLIVKSLGYMFLIAYGYFLKKVGVFNESSKDILGKMLMYIMLPCAFISNFRSFTFSSNMVIFFLIGLLANIIMITIGYIITKGRRESDRALYMIQCSGYNIGAFTIPFVSAFLPIEAVVTASIFDIGNCVMSVGGIFPLVDGIIKKERFNNKGVKLFLKNLFKSVPFDTYIVMLLISVIGLRMPETINNITAMIGSPSIIITMIMIGITFEINISKEDIGDIFKILVLRYLIGIIIAAIIWFFMDFTYLEKKIIAMCIVAPVTSISPCYCNLLGCKSSVYGGVCSLSVPISLALFIILMNVL